jgi:D-glycero-D-manno-heptose 1,7-bisphosphate phosphatase
MKLIILDRDGVINYDSDQYIRTVDQWIALPGSIDAIADLSKAGYKIAIATNQSGIGRGYYTLTTLAAMHQKMTTLVSAAGGTIDSIVYCPHIADDNCLCRKPLPGMLTRILEQFSMANTDLDDAWFVGDSLRDIQAGTAVNLRTVLVKTGKGEKTLANNTLAKDTAIYQDLADFALHLLHNQ